MAMVAQVVISNDRQEREARLLHEQISEALTSESAFRALANGMPQVSLEPLRNSLRAEKAELKASLEAYEGAKSGDVETMTKRAGQGIGEKLIAARLARKWTQKELARRLFLPEQQIQRYEAERYQSINLGALTRVARTLGVVLEANVSDRIDERWLPRTEMSPKELQKVVAHARKHGWIGSRSKSDEVSANQLRRAVAEHVADYGTPSLLRTGINVHDLANDWLLLSWKAQVAKKANVLAEQQIGSFKLTELGWLKQLVQSSADPNGPTIARQILFENGIALVVEPAPPGTNVDGAAFLQGEMPVVGMTLRYDREDNFWFTLLHELGHIILHHRTGLSAGFFDDVEHRDKDEFEDQADEFAQEALAPTEVWARSPARISKSPEPIEALARKLSISPSILFGRARQERKNYKIFAKNVGQGRVRRLFEEFN
ncbi:MAG: XRE family transcriptional regulator [Erythrobacter sp.]